MERERVGQFFYFFVANFKHGIKKNKKTLNIGYARDKEIF